MSFRFTRSALWGAIALIGITGFFAAMMSAFYVPAFINSDPHGYLMTAKRLATHGDAAQHPRDPYEFVSNGMRETGENTYYFACPVGYPRICAVAYRLGGAGAVFLVNPILATLAVIGLFLLGQAMFGDLVGAMAAILLATNPIHALFGLSGVSHTGAVCLAVWGMFFVWRWAESGGWGNAVLGAALAGYGSTVRYTEALLVLPAVAMVIWRGSQSWKRRATVNGRVAWRRTRGQILGMTLVAVLAITPLLLHQWTAYGSPWVTGYSLNRESASIGWKWLRDHWWPALDHLNALGLPFVFPLGLAGLAFLVNRDLKKAVFLALWAIPGFLVYTGYYFISSGPNWLRYFLSLFPALLLGAMAMLCDAAPRRVTAALSAGLLVLLAGSANLRQTIPLLEQQMDKLLLAKTAGDLARAHVAPDTVILSDSQLYTFLDYVGEYRLYADWMFSREWIDRAVTRRPAGEPGMVPRRRARRIAELLGDKNDDQLGEVLREVVASHLAEGRPVVLLCSNGSEEWWRRRLGTRFDWTTITRWGSRSYSPATGGGYTLLSLYSLTMREDDMPAANGPSRR